MGIYSACIQLIHLVLALFIFCSHQDLLNAFSKLQISKDEVG